MSLLGSIAWLLRGLNDELIGSAIFAWLYNPVVKRNASKARLEALFGAGDVTYYPVNDGVLCQYDVLSGERRQVMNRISHVAAFAALCALPVLCLAQVVQIPAADKPAAPMKVEAKEEKMAPKPVFRRLTDKSREDARECLGFPTNQEIIICAEKYL